MSRIVCDAAVPYAAEAFGPLGDLTLIPGHEIVSERLRDADLLITTDVTKVNARLLDGSGVRFCAATTGEGEHLDTAYLDAHGIVWCAAEGCGAESVSDYVTAALFWLRERYGFRFQGKSIGVIGAGRIGRRVCRKMQALGLRVLVCDPLRRRDTTDQEAQTFLPLERLLREADVVTCHLPLIGDGPDATWHLLDSTAFARMRTGVVVINTSRGEIVDTNAWVDALEKGSVAHAVVDGWEGEPLYRKDLLARAELATPHIAGYSYESRVNGAMTAYRAACAFLGVEPTFPFRLPLPPIPEWCADAAGLDDEEVLRELVLAVYDIDADSRRMKMSCAEDLVTRAQAFKELRSCYPMRRQFNATQVVVEHARPELIKKIEGLGFVCG